MTLQWETIWMKLFGRTAWLGLNMGFWVSLAAVAVIVILMNAVFWGMKPRHTPPKS